MKEVMIATSNKNKVREFKELLEPLGYTIHDQSEIGEIEVIEDGETFAKNAAIKASSLYDVSKMMTIADDSGLMIEAFNNAPGIHSARFLQGCDYSLKNQAIIQMMENINNRNAKFVCAICLIDEDGQHIFQGEINGKIADSINGKGGFGYDPIFFVQELNKTFGQLTDEEKNSISHRGKAVRKMLEYLKEK